MTISALDTADSRTDERNSLGIASGGFRDPSGHYPKPEYEGKSSVNEAARGAKRHALDMGGGLQEAGLYIAPGPESLYPHARVDETPGGHVVVLDDTPGGERVLVKHASGAGIEISPDGTISVKSDRLVSVTNGDSTVVVEGDGTMSFAGNLSLRVSGDLTFDVGGNFSVKTGGDKNETVGGSSRERVNGVRGSVVRGSRSSTTVGTQTDTMLGGLNTAVKGNHSAVVQGDVSQAVSGAWTGSAQGSFSVSSPKVTMGASVLALFGASGTVGGDGVVHYGSSFRGDTFHGDLKGTAEKAIRADVTNSQDYSAGETGTALGYEVENDTSETASMSEDDMDEFLNQAAGGVKKVLVDEGDFIKNLIDRTVDNGGISSRTLTTREVRSKLRDPAAMKNDDFLGAQVSAGTVSPNFAKSVPPGVSRMTSGTGSTRVPRRPIGGLVGAVLGRFRPKKNRNVSIQVPAPVHDPMKAPKVDASTRIGAGTSLAKFLGGHGDPVSLAGMAVSTVRDVARQFTLQAAALRAAQESAEFKDFRIVVERGLYRKGEQETLTPGSLNERAVRGEVVVYEVLDSSGKINAFKTYDLAVFWKDHVQFDTLSLSYDTLNPDGSMTAQVILTMPPVDETYTVKTGKFKNELETLFNGVKQSNELVEILEA